MSPAPISSFVPAGFERHSRRSPLTDPWEPIYSRKTAEAVVVGLRIGQAHVNGRGFAHGGLISALADAAMGWSCVGRFAEPPSLVTVTLSIDFLAIARIGQWLEFNTSFVKTGATLCFAQCFVTADGEVCARGNASFRTLPRQAVERKSA